MKQLRMNLPLKDAYFLFKLQKLTNVVPASDLAW